jgi:5'-nucleotidase
MVKPFNRMNVDISCVGNHDLDLGLDHAEKLMKKTNCPWILTNLVDTGNDSKPVANALPSKVLEHQGFKIGFLGFAEKEWICNMHDDVVDSSKMKYLDYNDVLREKSFKLKNEENVI